MSAITKKRFALFRIFKTRGVHPNYLRMVIHAPDLFCAILVLVVSGFCNEMLLNSKGDHVRIKLEVFKNRFYKYLKKYIPDKKIRTQIITSPHFYYALFNLTPIQTKIFFGYSFKHVLNTKKVVSYERITPEGFSNFIYLAATDRKKLYESKIEIEPWIIKILKNGSGLH